MEHHNDLIAKARQFEREENFEEAAPLYEKVVQQDPLNENAINRLLIIYRKLKEYRKEIQLLNTSIKASSSKMQEQQTAWSKKHPAAARASKSLLRSLGGARAKVAPAYEEAAVRNWRKRKENLVKRMKKV